MILSRFIVNILIDMAMLWYSVKYRRILKTAFLDPATVQEKVLEKILTANAETLFGKKHGFASIKNITDYRNKVPVQSFSTLNPFIELQMSGETALTREPPVYYAKTSGTTGSSKFIPVTQTGLGQMQMSQRLLSISLWRNTGFFSGSILGMASPMMEGRLENGIAYGSSSGSAYRSLSRLLTDKFAAPAQTFEITDVAAKYQVYAMAVLASPDISGIVAANPSSILKVCEIIESDQESLLGALNKRSVDQLLPEAAPAVAEIFKKMDVVRVQNLLQTRQTKGLLSPKDVWPNLTAIATWSGGSCGIAIGKLRSKLPQGLQVVEYGYAASEFMGTFNFDAGTNVCMPLITEHLYEFVPRIDWDEGRQNFLGIQDLIAGKEYYVFVTTQSGLYRYDINDLLLAGPGVNNCPSLSFLQKGRGVTNITGEKLSEHQVIAAASESIEILGLTTSGYIFLANEKAARYEFYLESDGNFDLDTLAEITEKSLQEKNSEYADKRASGRLYPLAVRRLKIGAVDAFRDESVSLGVRETQYKPIVLDYLRNWSVKLAPWAIQDGGCFREKADQ
jgi:hypothetical protein